MATANVSLEAGTQRHAAFADRTLGSISACPASGRTHRPDLVSFLARGRPRRRYPDHISRRGIEMTFHSEHRPIEAYARALERAGFVIERIREPIPDEIAVAAIPAEGRWRRIPNFLMVRARKERR